MAVFWKRSTAPASEARSAYSLPLTWTYDDGQYDSVNLSSADSSLQSIAFRSAADLVASLVSELPVHVYSGEGSERRRRQTPGYLEDPGGDGNGVADWIYQLMMSWLLRGNGYGDVVEWSRTGYPMTVSWFFPDDVGVTLEDGSPRWRVNGRDFPAARMLHKRVNSMPGRLLGLSPVSYHATTIGLSLTSARFGNQWFRDGAHPSGMLVNTEVEMTTETAQVAKARFLAALRGTREPLVLGRGWEYKAIQVAPEESQFLETQGYTEAQCARILGPGIAEVMGYETGGSMTYANVVDRRADVLAFSLNRWANRIDRLLTSMLPAPQYARLNRDALLEATTLERYKAHALATGNAAWKTVNEVRGLENQPPIDGGDELIKASEPIPTEPPEDVEPRNVVNLSVGVDARQEPPVTTVENRYEMPAPVAPSVTVENRYEIDATTHIADDAIRVDARTTVQTPEPRSGSR